MEAASKAYLLCGAKTRSGKPCAKYPMNEKRRCRLHGGLSTGPKTAEGRARIAAAHFKHGKRSKAFTAAQRARNAKGRAIQRELKSIEAQMVLDGLLPRGWEKAFKVV